MKFQKTLVYPITVQFEDVDFGGAVHNPNYLKYFERSRNHHLAENGFPMGEFIKNGNALVIGETNVKYVRPALPDQKLFVLTRITRATKIALRVDQCITNIDPSGSINQESDDFSKIPGLLTLSKTKLVHADLKRMRPAKFSEALAKSLEMPEDTESIGKSDVDLQSA